MGETLTQVRTKRLEANAKVMELAGEDELTEEQEADLAKFTKQAKKLSEREAAMVAAGADEPEVVNTGNVGDDKEAAEYAQLVTKARGDFGSILDVAVFDRRPKGAAHELQQEIGIADNVIPLECFAASTVTSAGDSEVQEDTIMQVFPSRLSMAMGVDRRSVGVGVHNVPVVTAPTGAVTAVTAIGTTVADSAVTIEGHTLTPSRLQASATMGRDELATFMGLEADVEMTLREALESGFDYQSLYADNDTSQAGGEQGLLNHGDAPTAGTDVVTFESGWADVVAAIDGRYASRLADLATVVGPTSYRLMSGVYKASESDETLIEKLDRLTAGVMTSAHVAGPDGSDDQQAVVARGGSMYTGQVQRIWGGVEVIPDRVTLAADGQVKITLVVMMATALVRAAVFRRFDVHTTA